MSTHRVPPSLRMKRFSISKSQWREMIQDPETKIGRPRQVYIGATERKYEPISGRELS